MARGTGVKLTREVIVDAAVAIARRASPEGLTGRTLGKELGVDRSAVWRHFTDQDALLLAVGDRMLQMVVDQVPRGLAPEQRLRLLAHRLVEVFLAHPYVAAQTSCRFTGGPGELAATEMMLTSLEQVGLRGEAVARYQRTLADTLLAYAGMRAVYETLPRRTRMVQDRTWLDSSGAISAERHPAIARHLPALADQDDDSVLTTLLDTLMFAIIAAADDAEKDTPR